MKLSIFFNHIQTAQEQTGKSFKELLEEVKQSGIQAVEINLDYLLEHKEIWELLKEAGLSVNCIFAFYDMLLCIDNERICKHIETAVEVGANSILVVPGFLCGHEAETMQHNMPVQKTMEEFMVENDAIRCMERGLSFAVEYGKEKGISVIVENFDNMTSPLSGVNGVRWFLKQIPDLRYALDTGNYLYYGEDLLEVLELLKDKIVHIHCKDRHIGDNKSVEIGQGYIPISEIVHRLRSLGYEGYLAIEQFGVDDQEGCFKRGAAYLNSLLA